MIKFKLENNVGALQQWSFDNPASDYRVKECMPASLGYIDVDGRDLTPRFGIWLTPQWPDFSGLAQRSNRIQLTENVKHPVRI